MPGMVAFVSRVLREHRDQRSTPAALTAKSYFCQEAEGFSREAKLEWARLRGGFCVSNLQHDGVVMALPARLSQGEVDAAVTSLAACCSRALGYEQLLDDKPMFTASAGAADGDGGGGDDGSDDDAGDDAGSA